MSSIDPALVRELERFFDTRLVPAAERIRARGGTALGGKTSDLDRSGARSGGESSGPKSGAAIDGAAGDGALRGSAPGVDAASTFVPYSADTPALVTCDAAELAAQLRARFEERGLVELAALSDELVRLAESLYRCAGTSGSDGVQPFIYQMF